MTYTITLTVRTDAPIAVLRDARAYSKWLVDQHFSNGGLAVRYELHIERAEAKELEPWDAEAQLEFGGCS